MKCFYRVTATLIAAVVLASASTTALADAGHGKKKSEDFGRAGAAAEVNRTVTISMDDNFYTPHSVQVKKGDTIRFLVTNDGAVVHEFAIGTPDTHAGHQVEMMKMMDAGMLEADRIDHNKMSASGMMHDDPNSVLLEPGKSGEVIWHFTRPMKLEFACNLPGHYEDGMAGDLRVTNGNNDS